MDRRPEPLFPFLGQNAMAQYVRAHDWSDSVLGPPEHWPRSLRSVLSLVAGSKFPMYVAWGPTLALLYNDGYAEILGDKHPAALGRPHFEVWAEARARVEPFLRRALAGESLYVDNLPLRLRRRGQDEDAWFCFSYSPVIDERGRIEGIHCVCMETTRMVLAEQTRLDEKQALLMFANSIPAMAWIAMPDGSLERFNSQWLLYTGQTEQQALGRGWTQALHPDDLDGLRRAWMAARGSGSEWHAEYRLRRHDGVYRWFMTRAVPQRDAAGQMLRWFGTTTDIEDSRRIAQSLRDADRQKDEFLATLAHELRNPLAPIRMAAHLLASPTSDTRARQRAVDVIGRQVGQMARLLDDLMDVARITQRKLELRREWVLVADVVQTALEAARPGTDARRQSLTVTRAQEPVKVYADAMRLAQILSNLLNNASKYTDAGGRIALQVDAQSPWLSFTVTDNGIGLTAPAIDTIFAMFAQEHSALDRSEGGLGIGLSLVKGLVELHGGSVSAHSEGPGRGSRFVVLLPYEPPAQPLRVWPPEGVQKTWGGPAFSHEPPAQPQRVSPPEGVQKTWGGPAFSHEAQAGASPASPDASPVRPPADPRTVLVAEDNRDAADTLAELLRLLGHTVHVAYNGLEAGEMAGKLRPEVMVLDIGMPGQNGYEVARHIRSQPWGRDPLLIATTGWGQQDDKRKAMEAGFDMHLTKPVDGLVLDSLIRSGARVS